MSELLPVPAKPRTLLPMALWSAGILAALGATWCVGAVVIPVWQARAAVKSIIVVKDHPVEAAPATGDDMSITVLLLATEPIAIARDQDVAELGGPGPAARKLGLYLRSPLACFEGRVAALEMLGLCGRDGIPVLAWMLGCQDPDIRFRAVEKLGLIGGPDATGPLLRALRDRSPGVRLEAIDVLCQAGNDACLPELDGLVRDPDTGVRLRAIGAFAHLGKERAIDSIAAVLRDSQDEATIFQAASALRHIGLAAEDALIAGLEAHSPTARTAAAAHLGLLGGPRARAALGRACKDRDPMVSFYAQVALSELASRERAKRN